MSRKPVLGPRPIEKAIRDYTPDLTPVEWAYVAGIIDGEGTISIIRVKKREARYLLQPVVSVSNTSEPLVRWLGEKLDMRVDSRSKPITSGALAFKRIPATCYTIQVYGYRCYNLIAGALPYLIVKRDRAETVTAFIESRLAGCRAYNAPYTQAELALWLKVRALNRNESAPYDALAALNPSSMT